MTFSSKVITLLPKTAVLWGVEENGCKTIINFIDIEILDDLNTHTYGELVAPYAHTEVEVGLSTGLDIGWTAASSAVITQDFRFDEIAVA